MANRKKRQFFLPSLIMLLLFVACRQKSDVKHDSPRILFPGLFEAVQSQPVFPDSKTFPDCMPKRKPAEILDDFSKMRGDSKFNLAAFVQKNFSLPETAGNGYKSNVAQGVEDHISELWNVLQRRPDKYQRYSSLIGLPYPYIVPGGRFREIYYWDSYFTMLGLEESGRMDLVENMVNNFAFLIRTYGFIPNGNRTYYLTRSQPPFFSLMVKLLMENRKNRADSVLKANRDALEKEYHFWMDGRGKKEGAAGHVVFMKDGVTMNRYFDKGDWPREEAYREDITTAAKSGRSQPEICRDLRSGAESGWDFSSRWFSDGRSLSTIHTTEVIPVDLNSLLYHLEKLLADAYRLSRDDKARQFMLQSAQSRKKAVIRYCWDSKTGFFRDYNWKQGKQSSSLSLAGIFPLYFGIASAGQADSAALLLQQQFLKPGGLVTTLINTGQQWDAPNGWAPLQWMAIAGLEHYNKTALASEIARRWSHLNIRVFNKTGKLLEKYNVADTSLTGGGGEYPNQDGFGWTNGVLMKILKRQERMLKTTPQD